ENVRGTNLADNLNGDANLNVLRGLGGNDELYGAGTGADELGGGPGNHTSSLGDDGCFINEVEDNGGGIDTVVGIFSFDLTDGSFSGDLENAKLTDSANPNLGGNQLN